MTLRKRPIHHFRRSLSPSGDGEDQGRFSRSSPHRGEGTMRSMVEGAFAAAIFTVFKITLALCGAAI